MYSENLPAKYTDGLKPEEIPTLNARTRRKVAKFLKAIKEDDKVSVTKACQFAKIDYYTLAKWKLYPEFQFLFDQLSEMKRLKIEDYSVEQCFTPKGVLERIFQLKKLDHSYRDKQENSPTNIIIKIDPAAVIEALARQERIEKEIALEGGATKSIDADIVQ